MRAIKLAHARTQSKIIFAITIIAMVSAVGLGLHHHRVEKIKTSTAITPAPPQIVVVDNKRMTANEKLVYDANSKEVARVEIVGKR